MERRDIFDLSAISCREIIKANQNIRIMVNAIMGNLFTPRMCFNKELTLLVIRVNSTNLLKLNWYGGLSLLMVLLTEVQLEGITLTRTDQIIKDPLQSIRFHLSTTFTGEK